MSINQLINELKENDQDFEFYPTTKEMIKVIYNNSNGGEWLDIGAGTCNFRKFYNEFAEEQRRIYDQKYEIFRNSYKYNDGKFDYDIKPKESQKGHSIRSYYVIEKSKILLQKMDKDIICLGTDFNNTMLLDKPVNNIFCNPPYSEYENWTMRLILEANTKNIFLIIPERWKDNEKIQNAIKKTKSVVLNCGSFDFQNAERTARAKVEVIKITKNIDSYSSLDDYNNAAFDEWFDETFKMRDKKDCSEWDKEEAERKRIKNMLVNADESKAKILVDLYNEEIETLYNHFKAICSLDVDILETIGISKKAVKEALKKKASGAKIRYWRLAINELEEVTSRLTSKTREALFNRFKSTHTIDFTLENLYPVILWILKNANEYYNDQLIDFFKKLSSPDNVKPYKSNQKVFERDEWRHSSFKNSEKLSHYTLDYRIIMSSPFRCDYYGKLDGLDYGSQNALQDIFTIANNLGFKAPKHSEIFMPDTWGEKMTVYYKESSKVFMEYRVYKNGNMHVKFDLEFAKALNVEVSRLLGWIRSKEDIKKEFPNELAQGAERYFKANYTCLNINSMPLLTVKKKPELDYISDIKELAILINSPYNSCLETVLNKINKADNETITKCLNILRNQKGFIYHNCLITKEENKTKIEFRKLEDFQKFENLVA